jgi:uncharacterized protein
MITTLFHLLIILLSAIAVVAPLRAGDAIPEITSPVNDYAGVIDPEDETRISGMIVAHREKTGVQVAVLTVNTTGGVDIEDFSIRTAEKWGGGTKGRDDGLLFTIAVYDRRMRLEVGYGLEGYITDLKAGRILDGIRGDFKKLHYGPGVEKAVTQIISLTSELRPGEAVPVSARLRGVLERVVKLYSIYFALGVLAGFFFVHWKKRFKLTVVITVLGALLIFLAVPVLLQVLLPVSGCWAPVTYLMGTLAGVCIVLARYAFSDSRKLATVLAAIPAMISFVAVFMLIQVMKPANSGVSGNETALIVILLFTAMFQLAFIIAMLDDGSSSGGASYSSDSSSSYGGSSYSDSSSSSSSSSSSDSSSWSGDSGSFGGGGASSSW